MLKIPRKSLIDTVKKNGFTAVLVVFTLTMVLSSDAKAWMLQQLLKTGLFNTKIERVNTGKETTSGNLFFELNRMDGTSVTSEALKGKVVFINFWASWCPPCRAEMPSLQALYNNLKDDKEIVFLFVTEDNDTSKARAYLKKQQLQIPVYFRSGKVSSALFSGTLPTTVIIDKGGDIVLKHEGLGNFNTAAFVAQLNSLH